MKTIALYLGIIALWITLNRWVLPWFGVHTCMSGGCAVDHYSSSEPDPLNCGTDAAQSKGNQP